MLNSRFLKSLPGVFVLSGFVALAGCYTVKTSHVYQEQMTETPPRVAPEDEPPPAITTKAGGTIEHVALLELQTQAESSDPDERCNAIEALQDAAPDDASDPAIAALTDSNPQVRFAGCMAVGTLRLAEAHDQLLTMREKDKSRVVEVGVRYALHRLGDTRYSHDLEQYAVDPNSEVRGKTAFVLGRLGEKSAIPLLRPMRKDPEGSIRLEAAASLWLLGDQKGLDDLVGYAISLYADDLILSTLALAAPRDEQVIQHVRANLTADYPEVELAAARGLGELGSDEGFPLAISYVKSPESRQRAMAAMALGAIGNPTARSALSELLSDSSPDVRLAAATAILELRKKS